MAPPKGVILETREQIATQAREIYLQAGVSHAMPPANASFIEPEERAFRPHITVVRRARAFATERLAQRTSIEWSSFKLMESVSGPGGVSYVPLKQ